MMTSEQIAHAGHNTNTIAPLAGCGMGLHYEWIPPEQAGDPEGPGMWMWHVRNRHSHYVGNVKDARFLAKLGIEPELACSKEQLDECRNICCCIGKSATDGKWYGWSHRAIYGFTIGDKVKEGDCCATTGWTEEYIAEHPEEDLSLPVGFVAKTEDDCRKMAIAFAESVG